MIQKLLINPAPIARLIFPRFIYHSPKNEILITIDDSPNTESTPQTLKILDQYHIKALFFCVGKRIEQAPELLNEIVAAGHSIANHSYSHVRLNTFSSDEIRKEIRTTNEIIQKAIGQVPFFFRPPYARFNRDVISAVGELNLRMMMWSLLTYDFRDDARYLDIAPKYLQKNSIVVLHDNLHVKNIFPLMIERIVETAQRKRFNIGSPEGIDALV
jgi:peptidoglycan/xylan/chitin deacetylase (PgdA/CDA1 family)